MKIAVTGVTGGIGEALGKELAARGHEVAGFSRANGFDLESVHEWAHEVCACDALANVAFHPSGQLTLLSLVAQSWRRDQDKRIVNVSSAVVWFPSGSPYHDDVVRPAKRALDAGCRELALSSRCRISTVAFGMVDTASSRAWFPKAKKIPVGDAAKDLADNLIGEKWELYKIVMPR